MPKPLYAVPARLSARFTCVFRPGSPFCNAEAFVRRDGVRQCVEERERSRSAHEVAAPWRASPHGVQRRLRP